MEIQILPPFSPQWRKGYLQVHPNGRKYICLFNSEIERTIMSYARYLMSVHLGYIISNEYEVDHKNNDRTDDRIENLQLLTKEENRLKQEWWYAAMVQKWTLVPCTFCTGLIYITERELRFRNIDIICCSKSCAASLQLLNAGPRISQEDITLIKDLRTQGLSSYKIADKTGFARNTVMKYW